MIKKYFLPAVFAISASAVFADTIKLNMGEEKTKYTARDAHAINTLLSMSSLQKSWTAIEPLLEARFARLDPEGDGYNKIDQNKRALITQAARRSRTIQKWLSYDLDGDGKVTDAEIREFASQPMQVRSGTAGTVTIKPTEAQKEQILDQIIRTSKLPDPNKDGVTEFSEMLEASNNEKAMQRFVVRTNNQVSFEFDTDKNGTVTQKEFMAHHKEVFGLFDKDSDGTIDLTELKTMREAQRETRLLIRR